MHMVTALNELLQGGTFTLLEEGTWLPVSVERARQQCRVYTNTEDAYLESLIRTATKWLLDMHGLVVVNSRFLWETTWRDAPQLILPFYPVAEIIKVEYFDTSGTLTTLPPDDYSLALGTNPPYLISRKVRPWFGSDMPQGYARAVFWPPSDPTRPLPVRIEMRCGWPDAGVVPHPVQQAILLLVGHFYENRSATEVQTTQEIALGVTQLLTPYITRII
jgi:hypothetical protein